MLPVRSDVAQVKDAETLQYPYDDAEYRNHPDDLLDGRVHFNQAKDVQQYAEDDQRDKQLHDVHDYFLSTKTISASAIATRMALMARLRLRLSYP